MLSIFQDILSKSGGGVQPSLIYLPQVQGGGLRPPPPPPTLLRWRHRHTRIYQFIHLLYLFMYLLIRLFSYSFILNGISIYFCIDPLYMYITTLNRNDMCIERELITMLYYFGLTETIDLRFSYRNMSIQWCK